MTVKQIIKGRKLRGLMMDSLWFLPDKLYIKLFYWAATGKRLNLKKPKGFNEKLQWLKLHEDYSCYSDFCDKIKVQEIIKEKLGDGYTFPLLGHWKTFDEINFDELPEEFVLKCNHDSGSTKLIHAKSKLSNGELRELRSFYNRRVQSDSYLGGREPCYKGIERYIMAEPLMKDENGSDASIKDYKFFCFSGKPEIMFVATDRNRDLKFDFYDMDFNHLDITNIHPQSGRDIQRPKSFDEMKEIAAKLSQGMKFVRIDLYELNGKVYFGEFTFFHGGGFNVFYPEEWERKLGDLIDLKS